MYVELESSADQYYSLYENHTVSPYNLAQNDISVQLACGLRLKAIRAR